MSYFDRRKEVMSIVSNRDNSLQSNKLREVQMKNRWFLFVSSILLTALLIVLPLSVFGCNPAQQTITTPATTTPAATTLTVPPGMRYVGDINTRTYHYPDCKLAKQISAEDQIWFSSVKDAYDHRYKACTVCKPG